jgi:hypothetical protein
MRRAAIPTISSGAGPHCNGQVMILNFGPVHPACVKEYAVLGDTVVEALKRSPPTCAPAGIPGPSTRTESGRVDLYAELRSITEALDRAGVAYALVGGLAVSMYTVPRATEDIDVMLAQHDLARAIDTLRPLGFTIAGRPMSAAGGRLEIQRLTKIEGTDLLPLDLLVPLGRDLIALLDDRTTMDLGDRPISVVGRRGLRTLKLLRGSARDRADLEALGPETP